MDPRHSVHWFTSSYSGGSGTECVEVAVVERKVLVRDSKRSGGSRIAVRPDAWAAFIGSLHSYATAVGK
ncbi:DUF397 domain-containing protein [Streptomyces spectabilis]|uniref:DUF397 domain-containing protein n=1 Tax=Streptomyces spectabilis TaxID=68270 RepID=UPI0033F4A8AE